VRLIQLPFGGDEKIGIDDKRGALSAEAFALWLYEASDRALAVTKGQPFLQAATQKLKEAAQVFDGYTHNGRLIKIAVEAHKSNLPRWSTEPFLSVVQKCTRMNQAVFKGAVQEILDTETAKEDRAHAWMHDPEPWLNPVDPTEVSHPLPILSPIWSLLLLRIQSGHSELECHRHDLAGFGSGDRVQVTHGGNRPRFGLFEFRR
jgi:hypothetical protein